MGEIKEKKKAGEKRRGSNRAIENGGNMKRMASVWFGGRKGSEVGNTAPYLVFRENLDVGRCLRKCWARQLLFLRGQDYMCYAVIERKINSPSVMLHGRG